MQGIGSYYNAAFDIAAIFGEFDYLTESECANGKCGRIYIREHKISKINGTRGYYNGIA